MILIERRVAITAEDQPPWNVDPTIVDGRDFVALTTKDRGFLRFLTGNSRHAVTPWLEHLKQMRTDASLSLAADTNNLFEGTPSAAARKSQKLDCARRQQLGTLPLTVVIDLPAFQHLAARSVRCVTSLDSSAVVHIELTTEALEYAKVAALHWQSAPPTTKRRRSGFANVYWRESRKAWIACKDTKGVKRYKFFKPTHDNDDDAADEAAEDASRWIQCGDESDDNGAGVGGA